MTKRLLIEATHPEETRVVVVDGKRLEEFDYETASKRQLKGNIYLAKVTRVEPSLQAAFVDYGGNRHGFLAFSEIHPDYYQIPVADREALLAEQAAMDADNDEFEDARPSRRRDRDRDRNSGAPAEMMPATDDAQDDGVHEHQDEPATEGPDIEASADDGEDEGGDEAADDSAEDIAEAITAEPDMASEDDELQGQALLISSPRLEGPVIEDLHDEHHEVAEIIEGAGEAQDEPAAEAAAESAAPGAGGDGDGDGDAAEVSSDSGSVREAPRPPVVVETVGGDEAEEMRPRRTRHVRRYKIQEVIKRRQILLVQVTKEERGNKGAALTTYLSLAGRYCVLMPNTARGGGISRKINSVTDRKRLKSILGEMEIPDGMAVIVRTAGQERNKTELKRDYEYLLRLWDEIRELTLQSRAPALIYEEANLVKRAIRDMYARDVEEILVEGDESYKNAKNFMRMLMPSHAKRVQLFEDPAQHLFQKFQVEGQIDAIHNPVVQLRSGGYIVINTTEALVAIDVNSGRSTRERNIEETALRTNLEAAEEVARQLRLRDLAGLIVIDFIDMEELRNNAAGRAQAQGSAAQRPGAHPSGAHQPVRPAGTVTPAPAAEPVRGQHGDLPPLPRHRSCAVHGIHGAVHAARDRGRRPEATEHRRNGDGADGSRALHPQQQAGRAGGDRSPPSYARHHRRRRKSGAARASDGAQQDADSRAGSQGHGFPAGNAA